MTGNTSFYSQGHQRVARNSTVLAWDQGPSRLTSWRRKGSLPMRLCLDGGLEIQWLENPCGGKKYELVSFYIRILAYKKARIYFIEPGMARWEVCL